MPYWSLYLEALGFSAGNIGLTLGLMMTTRIVAPNLWAWLGDRTSRRIVLIRAGAVIALLVFVFIPGLQSAQALIPVCLAYTFFWSAVLPQFEVITLNHLRAGSAAYSRIRLWGSVGFVIASAATGIILQARGAAILPWLMMVLMLLIIIASAFIREAHTGPVLQEQPGGMPAVLRKPAVIALLVACFLMQASHGPYYVFFSIQLQQLDYGRDAIGALWALAVIAEVALLAMMPGLIRQFPLRGLFLWCFLVTAARWALMAIGAEVTAMLIIAQCLHAVSFGAYHAVAIQLIHSQFTGARQGRGQALYGSISFGAGGAAGSFISGWIWDPGQAWLAWSLAALAALLGAAVVWWGMEQKGYA